MLQQKKTFIVTIGGRIYKLAATESEEYIRTLSHYIDDKINTMLEEMDITSDKFISNSAYPVILALNIADDLYKEKKNVKRVKDSSTGTIDTDRYENEIKELKDDLKQLTRDNDQLKTQLSAAKRDCHDAENRLLLKTAEFNKITSEKTKEDEDIKSAVSQLSGKEQLLNEKQYELEILRKEAEKSNELVAELEAKNKELKAAIGQKTSDAIRLLQQKEKEIAQYVRERDAAEQNAMQLKAELDKAVTEKEIAEKSKAQAENAANEAKAKLEEAISEYNSVRERDAEAVKNAEDVKAALNKALIDQSAAQAKSEEALKEADSAKAELKAALEAKATAEKEVTELKTKLDAEIKATLEAKAAAEKKATEIKSKLDAALADKTAENKLSSELSKVKTALAEATSKNEALTLDNKKLNNSLKTVGDKNTELSSMLDKKTEDIENLSKKINDKNHELNNLSKKLADKNSALNELNQKSAEKNTKLSNVNKERDDLAIRLKAANGNIHQLKEENAKLAKALRNSSSNTSDNAEASQLVQKNEELSNRINDMKNNELSLNKKIADLEEKLAKSEAELKSFIEEFDK